MKDELKENSLKEIEKRRREKEEISLLDKLSNKGPNEQKVKERSSLVVLVKPKVVFSCFYLFK